jgi:hypothetical protein
MKSVGIFYGHLEYFVGKPFGIVLAIWQYCGNFAYFPPFWYIVSRKIWQP